MNFLYRYQNDNEETVEVLVTLIEGEEECYRVSVGEEVFEFSARLFHRTAFLKEGGEITLQHAGREYHVSEASRQRRQPTGAAGDLRAPMAGKIIQILVQPGDQVVAGDPLLILEAMKMEQQIRAPHDGIVAQILFAEGEQVAAGAELVTLQGLTDDTSDD